MLRDFNLRLTAAAAAASVIDDDVCDCLSAYAKKIEQKWTDEHELVNWGEKMISVGDKRKLSVQRLLFAVFIKSLLCSPNWWPENWTNVVFKTEKKFAAFAKMKMRFLFTSALVW